jgi:hypothetical protein
VQKFVFELDHSPTITELLTFAVESRLPVAEVHARASAFVAKAGLSVTLPEITWSTADVSDKVLLQLVTGVAELPRRAHRVGQLASRIVRLDPGNADADLRPTIDAAARLCRIGGAVTEPFLINANQKSELLVARIYETIREWLFEHLDLQQLSKLPSTLYYFWADKAFFVGPDDQWRRPSAFEFVRRISEKTGTIGDYFRSLEDLRVLGTPVPEVAPDLAEYRPDEYDVAMCEENVGLNDPLVPLPDDLVTPLHLVRVAGRFGWELPHTYDRLAAFESLGLRMAVDRADVPDGIVHWADLVALTTELDGWPPAVSGTVGADHLHRAAEATGETVERTRERLARYATLFRFTLTELTEPPERDR